MKKEVLINEVNKFMALSSYEMKERIRTIKSQRLLTQIAIAFGENNPYTHDCSTQDVLGEIIKKVNNEHLLAKIAISNRDSLTRLRIMEKISSEKIKAHIIIEATKVNRYDSQYVERYLNQFSDKNLVIEVLKVYSYLPGLSAINILSNDEEFLFEIATSAKAFDTRALAVEKLTTQPYLEKIATNTNELSSIRLIAIGKLENRSLANTLLFEFAVQGNFKVVKQIKDSNYLMQLALNNENESIRIQAVKGITSQAILATLAIECSNAKVRDIALAKIKNQKYLLQVAKNCRFTDTVRKASQKLDDENYCHYLCNN